MKSVLFYIQIDTCDIYFFVVSVSLYVVLYECTSKTYYNNINVHTTWTILQVNVLVN